MLLAKIDEGGAPLSLADSDKTGPFPGRGATGLLPLMTCDFGPGRDKRGNRIKRGMGTYTRKPRSSHS